MLRAMAVGSWTDAETLKLIALWSEEGIQAMLEGCKRNKDVFLKLAKQMEVAGMDKTADQCNRKINKLKYEYRKIRISMQEVAMGERNGNFTMLWTMC